MPNPPADTAAGRSRDRPVHGRPRVVELWQSHPAAPNHHVNEPADESDAGHIEHQRENEIELAVPEADPNRGSRMSYSKVMVDVPRNSNMKP